MGLINLPDRPRIFKPIGMPQIDWDDPLNRGLVGYWGMFPYEFGGKVIHDLSGNGNTGDITGAIWTPHRFGSGLQFDGDNDFVNCGSKSNLNCNGNEITIVMSIRQKLGSTITQYDTVMARYGPSYGYRLWTTDSSSFKYSWYVRDGGGASSISSTTLISSTDFQHIACVCKASSYLKLYIDGIEEASDLTLSHGWNDDPPFYIGAMDAAGPLRFFPMDMEYLYVYSRVLSASEIAELYRRPF